MSISDSISKKVILILSASIAILFIVMCALLFVSEKNKAEKTLRDTAQKTIERISNSLIYPMWDVELRQVTRTIDLEMSDRNIISIIITESAASENVGKIRSAGDTLEAYASDNPQQNQIVQAAFFKLKRPIRYEQIVIGQVEISYTDYYLKQATKRLIRSIVAVGVIFSLLILCVIYFSLRQIILNPLIFLQRTIEGMSKTDSTVRLPITSSDEIGRVAGAFNAEFSSRLQMEEALRESEKKYRGIFDNATEGIFQATLEGEILTANTAFAQMFGYSSTEEILGFKLNMQQDFFVDSKKNDEIISTLADAGHITDFEADFFKKDGMEMSASLNIHAVTDTQGETEYLEGNIRDITEKKRAEEYKKGKELAEASTKTKSEFLANMSHEIRTPMNAIIGFAELLASTELNRKQKDFLGRISSSSESLLGLINDILDLSKIEAGKLDMESVNFSLYDIIQNLSDMFSLRAADKGVEFIVSVDEDVPDALIGDPLRLKQILINLSNNALKFVSNGEILIQTTLLEVDDNECRFRFTVRDTGMGIAPEVLPKLFEAFTQADSSTTRKHGGTGLGLTISKLLVEKMNGQIWAESEQGIGSAFHFTIMLGKQSQEMEPKLLFPNNLAGLKVLIVDDNLTALDIIRRIIRSFGFKDDVAVTGSEAIVKIREQKFDLVIMDWKMPNLDGIAATRIIRKYQSESELPIIMLTAFGKEEQFQEAMAAGVTEFLNKPINRSTLFDTIMKVFSVEGHRISKAERTILNDLEATQKIRGADILLVEDNSINQELALEILGSAGVLVEVASNGLEGFDKVKERQFDAVLMDIQMPVMDGFESTEAIRGWEKSTPSGRKPIPIIAMTANAMIGDREKCLEKGMDDYVTKPIDTRKLFNTLAAWVIPNSDNVKKAEENIEAFIQKANNNKHDTHIPENLPGIDMKSAMERLAGNFKTYKMLLGEFVSKYSESVADFQKAVAENNTEDICRMAHSIKGVAGNLSAKSLQGAAQNIEREAKDNMGFGMEALLVEYSACLEEIINAWTIVSEIDKAANASRPSLNHDSNAEIDSERAAKIINELDDRLSKNNPSLEAHINALKECIFGDGLPEKMTEMESQANGFDFKGARDTLADIASSAGINLSPN